MKSRLPKNLTLSELVQLLGITKQAIGTHVQTGLITKTGPNAYALESVASYCAHLRQLALDAGIELAPERARYTRAKATREEMRLAQDQCELVHVSDVAAEVAAVFASVRNHFLGLGSKLAPRFPDPKFARSLIQGEVEQILRELSAEPDAEEAA